MSERDSLAALAEEISLAFEPLAEAIDSPENFTSFMFDLGWDLRQIPDPIKSLGTSLRVVLDIIGSGEVNISNVSNLIDAIKSLVSSINQIASSPNSLFPSTVDADEFKAEFPTQLIQFLIIEYLLDNQPEVGSVLKALGVIRVEEVDATATRPAHESLIFGWQDLPGVLDDPFIILKNAYQWGSVDFKSDQVLENISDIAEAFGIDIRFEKLDTAVEDFLTKDAIALDDDHNWALCAPIIEDSVTGIQLNLGVCLFMLPKTASDEAGLAIVPYGNGEFDEEMELSENLVLQVKTAVNMAGGIGLLIRPGKGIELFVDIISSSTPPSASSASGSIAIALKTQSSEDAKTVLIGSKTGSRVEFASVSLGTGVRFNSNQDIDAYSEFELKDGGIIIKAGEDADSFLSSLLPEDGFSVDFSILLGFSTSQGFYFGGSGGLVISLPAHVALGPIEIVSSTLAIKPDSGVIPLEVGATIKGDLGPLKAVVENIGLRANFTFPSDSSGNLGPLDLDLDFKPPNGVGLAIDAGTVKGGGYLYFDYDNERYAGALELYIEGLFALKAIALITTRMPDGSKGFSLLIIITAEFGTPIQLGYGFTLSGVGGLLGLHRTMRLEPMLEGVRTGAINSVMFPDDLIANAPRIISDLRNFFPPYVGIFLIGPMAKLGWSTPNLITLSLGVIIEIPGNVAIVGILKAVLPHEEAAILKLQVNFLGAIEFDKKRAYLFAALYDSRVLFITLEGEMGVLVAWGNNANLVLSVGGFHPSFDPPPLPFPTPKRIAISILNTSVAKVRVEGYFAITSNTAQFGAKAELFFGLSEFKIEGHLSFNALFRFSPFYFEISISVSLSVKVFGIGLFSVRFRGSLEGPTPWHIEGTGSISLLFFDISVDFSKTWGERKETTLPPITIMPLLKGEFEKLENWQAVVPAANTLLVSLREIEASEDLVLHPVGTLKISQRAVPLQLKLDKLGTQKPADNNYFDIDISGDDFEVIDEVLESHATAQIKNVSDKQKLSLPPYSDEKGGIELSVKGEQLKTSSAIKRVVRYEQIIIDNNFKRGVNHFVELIATFFRFFVKNGAVGKSPLSNKVKKQQMPFTDKIAVKTNTFVVANNSDNTPLAGEVIEFASYFKAEQYMDEQIKGDPTMRDNVHVIPHAEMREAV